MGGGVRVAVERGCVGGRAAGARSQGESGLARKVRRSVPFSAF